MGFTGGERTTRRAVAEVKARLRAGQRRVFRPWVTEPGLGRQWDWGEGPRVGGRRTNLWCAWLAWSRFRVVIAVWDRTLPTIVACLDTTLRRIGGVPTYALTDNERTVSVDHVAGVAVRHPEIVAVGRHYGMSIRTCVPADPQSKGGSEATVRIAKADLVPTQVNLAEEYRVFGQLEAACRTWCEQVNARPHRETRRPPVQMLAEEQARLHPLPTQPFTVAFGTTRRVNWDATVSVEGVRYSVPHQLVDTRVWVRFHGEDLVVTAVAETGPTEVARHARSTPGSPSIQAEHYPPQTAPLRRTGNAPQGRRARRRPRSWPWDRARRPGWSKPPPRARAESAARWPRRSRWPSCTHPGRSTKPWAPRRSPAGSPRTMCCASSPTRPDARSTSRSSGRARPTACNRAPPPGPASVSPPPTPRARTPTPRPSLIRPGPTRQEIRRERPDPPGHERNRVGVGW
jgi:transposase